MRILGQPCRIENIESTGTAETQAAIRGSVVRVVTEFLALQAMLAVVGLHGAGFGIVAVQARIAAEPDATLGIAEHAVNRVARQALLARQDLEMDGIGRRLRPNHARDAAAVGPDPDPAFGVDLDGVDRIRGDARRVVRIVAEYFDDRSVRSREVEAAAIGPEPHVPLQVLGNRRDAARADRPGRG